MGTCKVVLASIAAALMFAGCASNEGVQSEGIVQYQTGLPAQPWGGAGMAVAPTDQPSTVTPTQEPVTQEPGTDVPATPMPSTEQPSTEPVIPEPSTEQPMTPSEPTLPMAGSEAPAEPDPMVMEPEPEPMTLATKVVVDVTTQSQGGRYSPRNIGAVWVENSQGQWVKTLAVWAWIRGRYLRRYLQVNPSNNTVDAMTSATLRTHQNHKLTWDLTDASGNEVPDGDYSIFIEVTEKDAAGQSASVGFTKGGAPNKVMFSGPYDGFASYE